jgi:hypothetical protein
VIHFLLIWFGIGLAIAFLLLLLSLTMGGDPTAFGKWTPVVLLGVVVLGPASLPAMVLIGLIVDD